jgi:hypothetical protein
MDDGWNAAGDELQRDREGDGLTDSRFPEEDDAPRVGFLPAVHREPTTWPVGVAFWLVVGFVCWLIAGHPGV